MNDSTQIEGVASVAVSRVTGSIETATSDEISVEQPLEIRIGVVGTGNRAKPLSVTMRTPGQDVELAAGFLFTEGIIAESEDLVEVKRVGGNAVEAWVRAGIDLDTPALDRHSFVSSSCGACGKRTIAAVRGSARHLVVAGEPRLALKVIHGLPEALRVGQAAFSRTGGIHASGLFDTNGRLLGLREDVGRHNALDKLIGNEVLAGRIPLRDRVVLVSGRVSFELVQKASRAGVGVLTAVGAPSSLAVELARACGMTLIGFVRQDRFNVYAHGGRMGEGDAGKPSRISELVED
jgi:FdhD protein